jgi:DNA polymerase I-like protein with 3'-5' exonuclease and polymerase domains
MAAGTKFNVNSPQQKQKILFGSKEEGGQGLKPWKPTDAGKKQIKAKQECTQWSTDDEVLESYPTNPVACTLRAYQEVNKLLSTYVLAYLGNPAKDKPPQIYDGRIHADFVQYGTTTRRFSCRDPNLQNIPRPDTELGKLIRGVWVAEPGRKLVVADYSSIELVVFAHFTGRGALFEGFLEDFDPHQLTADKLGVSRQFGKTINYSLSYGAGIYKIASMLGVDVQTAKSIMGDHRRAFPEIYEYKKYIIDTCRSRAPKPYVKTLLGGIRRLPDIISAKDSLKFRAERQAVSSVIQGSAADLIKLAMVRCDSDPALPEDTQMILSVHDEIVLDSDEEYAEETAAVLHEAMLGSGIQRLLKVPLKADIKIVDRWSEAK